ncbi:MAG: chemotaxis response regulator protein-glutamate methylesterase [Oscillospiraceae bacterium]|nr:chemotaxis response regulator protein-glutamate methylesterase [Oscillospiraceae bacterium]
MISNKKIRVLVVDDSAMFRTVLSNALKTAPDIEVIGTAVDAIDAKNKILDMKPDVITLDVEMPKMNGIEFLKKLLPIHKVAAIVVTASAVEAFDAISAGAVDYVKKPSRDEMFAFGRRLQNLVRTAATAKVGLGNQRVSGTSAQSLRQSMLNISRNTNKIIAIGASTGGTDAIQVVVENLPKTTPGIVIVQHMPAGFTKMYADRLNRVCQMDVKEAESGDIVRQGLIIIGAGEFHLRVRKSGSVYSIDSQRGEKVSGHCPSVDVLFESVAESAGTNAMGVILTGMGADGAKGLLQMKQKGAFTIGQDEKSSVVYGMPMVANNMGAVMRQAPLQNIAGILIEKLR